MLIVYQIDKFSYQAKIQAFIMASKITIDIISDISCPWCIIGFRALDLAVNKLHMKDDVLLNWLPFELNPTMPVEGQNRNDYIREKYGLTTEQGKANRDNLITRGKSIGYEFNFPDNGRVYNTFNAHRLLHWARESGLQTQLKLALFDLFFQQQGNPSDESDLLRCVRGVGLNTDKAKQILNSDEYSDALREELTFARKNNISGVPAFIFNKKHLISGGQPANVFVQALEQLKNEIV